MTSLCTLPTLFTSITWENGMSNAQHRALSDTF